jgi:hypothetical protein
LAGGSGFDYMRVGQKKKEHEYDTSDEEGERWSRPVDLVH